MSCNLLAQSQLPGYSLFCCSLACTFQVGYPGQQSALYGFRSWSKMAPFWRMCQYASCRCTGETDGKLRVAAPQSLHRIRLVVISGPVLGLLKLQKCSAATNLSVKCRFQACEFQAPSSRNLRGLCRCHFWRSGFQEIALWSQPDSPQDLTYRRRVQRQMRHADLLLEFWFQIGQGKLHSTRKSNLPDWAMSSWRERFALRCR